MFLHCRQFGQFDYGQVYNAQYTQAGAHYYPPTAGYSGSILTPDMSMSYTQQAADTNFDDEPPLLEGRLHRFVLFCSVFCLE